MAYSNFINLRIYQLSESLSDEIWDIITQWSYFQKEAIGMQLIRSADSIDANIAEGNGRGTFTDNKRFIFIARGSLYETKHFIRRACKRKLISPYKIKSLNIIIDELSPKLNSYINFLKKQINNPPTTNN
jgi:four helix bundle protein